MFGEMFLVRGLALGLSQQDTTGELVNDRITLWVYTKDCNAAIYSGNRVIVAAR